MTVDRTDECLWILNAANICIFDNQTIYSVLNMPKFSHDLFFHQILKVYDENQQVWMEHCVQLIGGGSTVASCCGVQRTLGQRTLCTMQL